MKTFPTTLTGDISRQIKSLFSLGTLKGLDNAKSIQLQLKIRLLFFCHEK